MSTKRNPKNPKLKLTPKQSAFAKAYMESHTLSDAAIKAGYSPKNARNSGFQAMQALIKKRVPEMMNELALSVPEIINGHLRPLLYATEKKFATLDGELSDYVEVEDNAVRMQAVDRAFRLHGAYAPLDQREAAQFGVKVVIIDVPRPQRGTFMPDVGPGQHLPPRNGNPPNGNKNK